MQEEQFLLQQTSQVQAERWYTPLTRVTPFSKYLGITLFIAMPFLGFWIGYSEAPADPVGIIGDDTTTVSLNSDGEDEQPSQRIEVPSSTSPEIDPPEYDGGKQVLLNGSVLGYVLTDGWQNGAGYSSGPSPENKTYTFLKRETSFTDIDLQTDPSSVAEVFQKKILSVEDTPLQNLTSHQMIKITKMSEPVREVLLAHLNAHPGIIEPFDPSEYMGQAWRIDVDGDGVDEELYNVYTLEPGSWTKTGGNWTKDNVDRSITKENDVGGKSNYAVVALYHHSTPDKSASTTILRTYTRQDDDAEYWPGYMGGAVIDGFVDLDGDSKDEFIISDVGTESASTRVFELQSQGPKVVLWTGGGA